MCFCVNCVLRTVTLPFCTGRSLLCYRVPEHHILTRRCVSFMFCTVLLCDKCFTILPELRDVVSHFVVFLITSWC